MLKLFRVPDLYSQGQEYTSKSRKLPDGLDSGHEKFSMFYILNGWYFCGEFISEEYFHKGQNPFHSKDQRYHH